MPSNVALILSILAGIVTVLVWFLNPKAVKARKLKKLNEELKHATDEREKARIAGDNDLYMKWEEKRNEILKEIGSLTGSN